MMPRGKADTLQIKRRPRAPPLAAAPSPAMPWLPRMLDPDAGAGGGVLLFGQIQRRRPPLLGSREQSSVGQSWPRQEQRVLSVS